MTKTGVKFDRKVLYVDGTEVKIGSRGRPQAAALLYGSLTKGERRRVRKSLHSEGHVKIASVSACNC